MSIHVRVVTPIVTAGWRTGEDVTSLESDGVKVDFSASTQARRRSNAIIEIMLSQPATIARIIEAERQGATRS